MIFTFAPCKQQGNNRAMAKNGNSFKNGESGNPAGRPKGAMNRTTTDLRTWINSLINKNLPVIEKDLKSLDSKDRLVPPEKESVLYRLEMAKNRKLC